ncbi:MAG: Sarcosine oxidase beta subunit, partial [uncultured Thermomicrobiales bacterium]
LLDAGFARVHRGPGGPRARAHAFAGQDARAPPVGGAVRHDAGLLPDHGHNARRGLPDRRGLGHLRVQGGPRLGRDDGRAYRHGQDARAHRPLRPRPVREGWPDGREGGRGRWAL